MRKIDRITDDLRMVEDENGATTTEIRAECTTCGREHWINIRAGWGRTYPSGWFQSR